MSSNVLDAGKTDLYTDCQDDLLKKLMNQFQENKNSVNVLNVEFTTDEPKEIMQLRLGRIHKLH